jgi:RNA polymerase sigma-70 factor (ECF subfamily)
MTEMELVRAAQKGDDSAFEALVRTYEKKVYHLALRMCGNQEDAYEIAQEAFLSAWKGLTFFRGESSFSTWLYRLASNAAIDFLRREKRQSSPGDFSLDDEETYIEPPDPSPTPQQHAEATELRAALAEGLNKLSPEHRQVLLLRELQGLSYEEIADALDLDLGTVKSRIARAREKLRKYLLMSGNFSGYAPSNLAEKEG